MDNKYILYFLIILFIIISYNNNHLYFTQKQKKRKYYNWRVNEHNTHILITRYKEPDIAKLLTPLINQPNVSIFIYNKGNDILDGIPLHATNIQIIKIPNLGWDAYAYFYHVIKNYDNLPDYIYSLHASAQYLYHKFNLLKRILRSPNINNKSRSKPDYHYYYGGDIYTTNRDFYLSKYKSSLLFNNIFNPENVFVKAKISPLDKWVISKLGNLPPHIVLNNDNGNIKTNLYGMFKVHKSRVLRYPLSFYENIFQEISVWQSEVNHFLERSWYAIYGS